MWRVQELQGPTPFTMCFDQILIILLDFHLSFFIENYNLRLVAWFPPLWVSIQGFWIFDFWFIFSCYWDSLLSNHGGGLLQNLFTSLKICICVMSMSYYCSPFLCSMTTVLGNFTFWLFFSWTLVQIWVSKNLREFWVYPRSNHYWKVTHKVVWQATTKMYTVPAWPIGHSSAQ